MSSLTALTYAQAIGLGAVAGMRSMSAPALVSYAATSGQDEGLSQSPLASQTASKVLGLLAVGEMIADKLPGIPDRTSTPSLAARAASGAFSGAAIFNSRKKNMGIGAAVGALAAVASAFAFYHLRRTAGRELNVPDAVVAVTEDALVVGAGFAILRAGAPAQD